MGIHSLHYLLPKVCSGCPQGNSRSFPRNQGPLQSSGRLCYQPVSLLTPLIGPERRPMDENISAALQSGIICPSSLPTEAGFSFVGKMNGSLSTCMVPRGLNGIKTKTHYPRPSLISTGLCCMGKVFSKWNMSVMHTTSFKSMKKMTQHLAGIIKLYRLD